MYVWLDVHTKYGATSIRINNGLYERAKNTPRGERSKAQDSICIRVRSNLERNGARLSYLSWDAVTIVDVREEGQELRRSEQRRRARRTQRPVTAPTMQLVTPNGAEFFDGEDPCGCMG